MHGGRGGGDSDLKTAPHPPPRDRCSCKKLKRNPGPSGCGRRWQRGAAQEVGGVKNTGWSRRRKERSIQNSDIA